MITRAVAIIPARGGSKRIPRKNIKDFFGKPLIAYSIETALASKLFDKVIVTTDDEEIANIAKRYGAEVPFIRPKELSDDFTGTGDVVKHALEYLKAEGETFDFACTIYATAPLLQEKYLVEGLKKLKESDAINAFSATTMPFPILRTFKLDANGRCQMFWPENFTKRSQDLEEAYQDAGQFYWSKLNSLSNEIMFAKDSIPIILPRYLTQDIDTFEDWKIAELMFQAFIQDEPTKKSFLKKPDNILFRSDSSSQIGIGHVMRDLVLAEQFKDDTVIFATRNLSGNINYKIQEKNYKIEILKTDSIEELIELINTYSIDMIVIDHYSIDYYYEKELKERTGIKIFALDDTYEKHHCDILLNHNIYAHKTQYKHLVPKECELRCGKNHTLLRGEFLKKINKRAKPPSNKISNVFLAMGGADHSNINISILAVLSNFSNIHTHLVTTSANKFLGALISYTQEKKNITLHIDTQEIARLMYQANLAIITPSVTANEIIFMETPFICIKTADNQKYMADYLKKHNYLIIEEFDAKELSQMIEQFYKKDLT